MKAFVQRRPGFMLCALTLALVLMLTLLVQPAMADNPELCESLVSCGDYSVPAPSFLPTTRSFYGELTVSIVPGDENQVLWNNTDALIIHNPGAPKSCNGYLSETTTLNQTTTLFAKGLKGIYYSVDTASATFTKLPAPGAPRMQFNDGLVILSGEADENETIYYTLDGSTPTKDSIPYTEPFAAPSKSALRMVIYGSTGESDTGAYGSAISMVIPTAPVFDPGSLTLENAIVGTAYSAQIQCTGRSPIEFSLTEPVSQPRPRVDSTEVTPLSVIPTATVSGLPEGLSLSPTGLISGTPTRVGTYTFTVWAKNNMGVSSADFTLTILPAQDPSTGGLRWYTPSADAPMLGGSDTDASRQDVPQGDANPNTGVR